MEFRRRTARRIISALITLWIAITLVWLMTTVIGFPKFVRIRATVAV